MQFAACALHGIVSNPFNFYFKIAAMIHPYVIITMNGNSGPASTYSKTELKKYIKDAYSRAFSGPGQDLQAYDEAVYYESLLHEMKIKELEAERDALQAHILSHEAQDEMAMIKLTMIEEKLINLRK
jgi:hypothetical protein